MSQGTIQVVQVVSSPVQLTISGSTQTNVIEVGVVGPQGPQGLAATVAAGTTTTGLPGTSASVTNSGTTSAAVFNFTIPQGASGVVNVTSPITNTGTLGSANIGINQSALVIAESQVTNLVTDLAAKAPLASPTFTGTVTVPLAAGFVKSSALGVISAATIAESDVTNLTTDLAAKATTAGTLAQFAATTSAQLAGVISDETGTGSLVFATSPTLVTPALGSPTSGILDGGTL